ncbi:Avl9p [Rhodotorula paludigena]|uniref:Avl9p n=1 Tax=Rhodotorula paludigena TaxID=86838 RepID=UPI003182B1B7
MADPPEPAPLHPRDADPPPASPPAASPTRAPPDAPRETRADTRDEPLAHPRRKSALLQRLDPDDPLSQPSPVIDVDDDDGSPWGTAHAHQSDSAAAATATTFPPAPLEVPLASTSTAFLTTPHLVPFSSASPPSASSASSPGAPPMHRSPSTGAASSAGARVWGVCLVGFDHALGPVVEFAHPRSLEDNAELQRNLPFFALPDGAHARDEDYSYFHLLLPSVAPRQTIFGISCNRQIPADQLINKGKDVTRSTVQKAIVVLASKPIFGPLRDKLGVVTRSFFAQRDFDDKSILVDLFRSFAPAADPDRADGGEEGQEGVEQESEREEREREQEQERAAKAGEPPLSPPPEEKHRTAEEDGGMYMGTSIRELVRRFRFKTLMLLKLVMLQRRVMFFAANTPVEQLCTFQYSLVTLIPALLTALDDAASPTLDERAKRSTRATSLKTSDKYSLIRYLGLPLDVFGKGSFFQPYLPLQQIDLLKTRSFLVGTTNSIFQQQRDCQIDVLVNIDSASLEILNPKLTPLITLTAADRKWMDELVTLVDSSWNSSDPSRPVDQGFVGSDDFIRAKFEEYVCSLLACVKFGDFLSRERGERAEMLLSAPELESYNPASFNEAFLNAFKRTAAYELWDRTTDEVIFDLVEPKHPMEGKTNPLEDVGIRLVHGLHDHLSDLPALPHLPGLPLPANLNLAPLPQKARERLSRGWSQGREGVWGAMEALREDWGKRQAQAQAEGAAAAVASSGSDPASAAAAGGGGAARDKPLPTPLSLSRADADSPPGSNGVPTTPTNLQGSFLAGVDVARTGAASLATGLGSFLGGAARKTSLFGGGGGGSSGNGRPAAAAGSKEETPLPAPPPGPATAALHEAALSAAPPASQQPRGGGLRPLSTAAAATVPKSPTLGRAEMSQPPIRDQRRASAVEASSPGSASTSSAAAAPPAGQPGSPAPSLAGFFGGLRRTLSAAAPPDSAPSTPGTPAGFGTPPAGSFLGLGGWGGRATGASGSAAGSSLGAATPAGAAVRARDLVGDWGREEDDDDEEKDEREREGVEARREEETERERDKARRRLEGDAVDV